MAPQENQDRFQDLAAWWRFLGLPSMAEGAVPAPWAEPAAYSVPLVIARRP